jgi:hypothetical protein
MESETLRVRCLHPVHYLVEHPRGAEIDLPVTTANHLAKNGIVEILSTIVELPAENPDVVVQGDEATPDQSAAETAIAQEEEAPKTSKKTSKRRAEVDDE